jgi:hypothetical protein
MSRRDTEALLNQMGITGTVASEIALELGDHPLAVQVFSRYVAQRNLKPTEALEQLRMQRTRHSVQDRNDEFPVGAILKEAFGRVSPVARNLLVSLAHARTLELKWPECVPATIAIPDALAGLQELAQCGLVQLDRLEAPIQLSVHPLVKDFVMSQDDS